MFVPNVGKINYKAHHLQERHPAPYCHCWNKRTGPTPLKQLNACSCGEENDLSEWKWQKPSASSASWVILSNDQKQVTFHPFYSSGTAVVKGDTPLLPNYHYYWEVKMLTDTYGTDIIVGLGTDKVNVEDFQFSFLSLLGQDEESYGLSYTGAVRHNASVTKDTKGFCRGTIIGVRVDMWRGTLEFYINRVSQGISFYNLRRHSSLYPMVSSTAAQSSVRQVYAASWRASLLVDAARSLGHTALPPGLYRTFKKQFWLTLPSKGGDHDGNDKPAVGMDRMEKTLSIATSVLTDILPSPYANGFYVDGVDRNYRVVVWE